MLMKVILVMAKPTHCWLWNIESASLFYPFYFLPHLHHFLLHSLHHITEGKYFLFEICELSVLDLDFFRHEVVASLELTEPLLNPAGRIVQFVCLDLGHLASLVLRWNQHIPVLPNY